MEPKYREPRLSEMIGNYIKALKKSGKLECQSEWKATFKSVVTRRA